MGTRQERKGKYKSSAPTDNQIYGFLPIKFHRHLPSNVHSVEAASQKNSLNDNVHFLDYCSRFNPAFYGNTTAHLETLRKHPFISFFQF